MSYYSKNNIYIYICNSKFLFVCSLQFGFYSRKPLFQLLLVKWFEFKMDFTLGGHLFGFGRMVGNSKHCVCGYSQSESNPPRLLFPTGVPSIKATDCVLNVGQVCHVWCLVEHLTRLHISDHHNFWNAER